MDKEITKETIKNSFWNRYVKWLKSSYFEDAGFKVPKWVFCIVLSYLFGGKEIIDFTVAFILGSLAYYWIDNLLLNRKNKYEKH